MSDAQKPLISIVLPCRNEALALGACLEQITAVVTDNNLNAEVIVSDSSVDHSPEIARQYGVRLISHGLDGYGNACREGLRAARGQYIFLADADGTYDFHDIPTFIALLERGNDIIIGNRFAGTMERGAMPWLNRFLGNPLLSALFRLLFLAKVTDVHCGARALTRRAFDTLNLRTTGMEFASEMIIKAVRLRMRVVEVPVVYRRRIGQSKLRRFSDGWRHLRFMFLYRPVPILLVPGAVLFSSGLILMAGLYFRKLIIFGITFQYHPIFIASALVIFGYQLIVFSAFAKSYAIVHLGERSPAMDRWYRRISLERGMALGTALTIFGLGVYGMIGWQWWASDFGPLSEVQNSILALTLVTLGAQTIFSSFVLSIIGIHER